MLIFQPHPPRTITNSWRPLHDLSHLTIIRYTHYYQEFVIELLVLPLPICRLHLHFHLGITHQNNEAVFILQVKGSNKTSEIGL